MLKINVNNQKEFSFTLINGDYFINNEIIKLDLTKINNTKWHIIRNFTTYNIEILSIDYKAKAFVLKINGNKHTIQIKDKYDLLLHELGIERLKTFRVNNIKAPMPGLVLDLKVMEGQHVKKNDAILILEAMKMENILKSPCDGLIKRIKVEVKEKVEKNQVLVEFE